MLEFAREEEKKLSFQDKVWRKWLVGSSMLYKLFGLIIKKLYYRDKEFCKNVSSASQVSFIFTSKHARTLQRDPIRSEL